MLTIKEGSKYKPVLKSKAKGPAFIRKGSAAFGQERFKKLNIGKQMPKESASHKNIEVV